MPRPDQSFPGSWIYIRHSVNVTCKLWFFALFCTCDICCMSVCPGRGIPPLWLFLRFLPSFFYPVKRVIFFHQHGKFFLTQIQGLRTEDVVHCTDCKAHWFNVIVILGYINKFDLIYILNYKMSRSAHLSHNYWLKRNLIKMPIWHHGMVYSLAHTVSSTGWWVWSDVSFMQYVQLQSQEMYLMYSVHNRCRLLPPPKKAQTTVKLSLKEG